MAMIMMHLEKDGDDDDDHDENDGDDDDLPRKWASFWEDRCRQRVPSRKGLPLHPE